MASVSWAVENEVFGVAKPIAAWTRMEYLPISTYLLCTGNSDLTTLVHLRADPLPSRRDNKPDIEAETDTQRFVNTEAYKAG